MSTKVLFVCTGNTCRSPMAAALLRRILEENGARDVAVASALTRMKTRTPEGELDMTMRWTASYRPVDGRWLIAHEHASFPVDMRTNQPVTSPA